MQPSQHLQAASLSMLLRHWLALAATAMWLMSMPALASCSFSTGDFHFVTLPMSCVCSYILVLHFTSCVAAWLAENSPALCRMSPLFNARLDV